MDAPITFSSQDEFERIIDYLLENGSDFSIKEYFLQNSPIFYNGVRISKQGIEKIEGTSDENEINNNKDELNESVDNIELKLRNLVTSTLTLETGKSNFEDLITGERNNSFDEELNFILKNILIKT